MSHNVAQKIIREHLVEGSLNPGSEIAIGIDQTLLQDATGTVAMLEFEALQVPRARTNVSVQYIDHNLIQADHRNPDDHVFLLGAARKYGLWFSRPGNGVSHPLHMERFGVPGATLLGSDSHTPAAGALGMLAIGAGGLDVAMAMAGEPFYVSTPEIWGVTLTGSLPDWISAKDVILEMLRRHGTQAATGRILEYRGPGLDSLSVMDRHVIANMGTELGATSTVFPSDHRVREFLVQHHREFDWRELLPDAHANYDHHEEINLSELEPLIACPASPGNVVPVRAVAGRRIYQSYIGSSANPGLRDFAIPARLLEGLQVHPDVSFDINPTSRQMLVNLVACGDLSRLVSAGARVHQAGCNGCIGMGQAPATGRISLRTVPRNFPGRSGTREDAVYLCSPETATVSALKGRITDPRDLHRSYPRFHEPKRMILLEEMFLPPAREDEEVEIVKGPNIQPLPDFEPLPDSLEGPVLLKVGDNISTDEIMPAGAQVLPYRSNIEEISRFVFRDVDDTYAGRAMELREKGSFLVAGENYGQGSSREHAAIAPRFLGVRAVLAKSFARLHRQNLINFGILPLTFAHPEDYDAIEALEEWSLEKIASQLDDQSNLHITDRKRDRVMEVKHGLSPRQIAIVRAGALINYFRSLD